jgi:hypothetical protein
MSLPLIGTMEDGTEFMLIHRDGEGGSPEIRAALGRPVYWRVWQASTLPRPDDEAGTVAFGVTEEAALVALLEKLQGRS